MEMLISASEEAFLHAGSMIGFFILLFGYINYKTSGNFTNIISKNRKLQPLMGALIGAIPGCGGSLAIMPLYIKGKLSFGAIIASLIASMGDASFVLISSNIKMYFFVTIVSTITGIITGQLVDYFKLEEKLGLKNRREWDKYNISKNNSKENKEQHNHDEIILDNLAKSHGNTNRLAFIITHGKGYKIYIGIILIGFIFMSLAHSGINLPIIEKLHSLEEAIAVIGILFSIIYMWCFKKVFKNSNQKEEENKKISLREMLIHSVGEISFVITWIFIAYLIYDLIILILGGDEYLVKLVLSTGVISVFIGAGLGLIPGCGIQIVLMSFYLKGTIPLGAVIANSISQDGDALFPLLAMDKKSSLWAMIITTIPAILVGMIVYVLLG